MGKKYIIEIEDGKEGIILCQKGIVTVGLHLENESELKPLGIQSAIPYTEPDLERVKKTAHDDGYSEGYQAGREDLNLVLSNVEQVRLEAEQLGMVLAWDAARKLYEIDWDVLCELFGKVSVRSEVLDMFTASEAIEKLKAYEQKQEEIKVGDEVIYNGRRCVVIVPETTEKYGSVMDAEGGRHGFENGEVEKTGRHFPEIAAVIEKMRGEQDE